MYTAQNFDSLLGISGLSDNLMKNHFTLYQGYINNSNKLLEILAQLTKDGKTGSPEFAELKRRFGWEFNGMRLHEYFFSGMTKTAKKLDSNSRLFAQIAKDFGSYENWEKEFKATAASRGIGWAILYYDKHVNKLMNVWINEHDVGHLAGCQIILNIDVFEHAFMIDYGLKRADYIETFMKCVDWDVVSKRL